MLQEREQRGEVGYSASVHMDLVVREEQRILLHLWGNLRFRGEIQAIKTAFGVNK